MKVHTIRKGVKIMYKRLIYTLTKYLVRVFFISFVETQKGKNVDYI